MGQAPPIFEKMEGKVITNVKINQVTENQALLGSEPPARWYHSNIENK